MPKTRQTAPDWLGVAGVMFFGAAMAATALLATLRPTANWDMIPYVGLVTERPGMDATALQREAYRRVSQAVAAEDWRLLTVSNAYRRAQYSSPSAFHSQLGMY